MNINTAEIDVNTTLSFCFIVPRSPIVYCRLNRREVINSTQNVTFIPYEDNVAVMINDWLLY